MIPLADPAIVHGVLPAPSPELALLLEQARNDPASLTGEAFVTLEVRLFEYARDLLFADVPPGSVVETIRVLLRPIQQRFWDTGLDDRMLRARTAALLAALKPEGMRRSFSQPGHGGTEAG